MPDHSTRALLQETVAAHVARTARIRMVVSTPLQPGLSGADVCRHELILEGMPEGAERVSLVTKAAWLRERRVLAWLGAQRQPSVPFSHTLDLATEGPTLVCLQ